MTSRPGASLRLPATTLAALLLATLEAGAQHTLLVSTGRDVDDGYASCLCPGPDLDGDGHDDLLVGAPRLSGMKPGSVQVRSGRTGALLLEATSDVVGDRFGAALAAVGDVDGDGVPDLAVGCPLDATGAVQGGAVCLVSGADGSLLLHVPGDVAFGRLGSAVAPLGDVDGDGLDDIALGAPGDPHQGQPGRVVCVAGRTIEEGEVPEVLWVAPGVSRDEQFGMSLATVPDLDGDGLDDLVVGAPGARPGDETTGRIVFLSGFDGGTILHVFGRSAGHFGGAVAAVGDVDGDDVPDVIVGDDQALVDGIPAGRAWIVSGDDGSFLHAFTGREAHDHFGFAVAGPGDVDGDGRPDVAIGAHEADGGGYGSGRVEVFSGATGRLVLAVEGEQPGAGMGYAVCAAGDPNQDGHADVAVGMLGGGSIDGRGGASPGAVHVIAGREAPPPPESEADAVPAPEDDTDPR